MHWRPKDEVLGTLEKKQAEKVSQTPYDPQTLSDAAALALYIHGEKGAENAISLIERSEQLQAGLYSNAINKATALEMLGRIDEAMEWVDEARERNPQPQAGTEWLQQLILRAKLELRTNRDWLLTNSILGADFGLEAKPNWPRIPDRQTWSMRSRQALLLQLRDRLPTAKKPDPILADLLFDFGNLQVLSSSPATALQAYELAVAFGTAKQSLAELRAKQLKAETPQAPLNSRFNQILLLILVGIAFAGFVRLFLARRNKPVTSAHPSKHPEKTEE